MVRTSPVNQLPYGPGPMTLLSPFKYTLLDGWWDPFLLEMVREEITSINEDAWVHTLAKAVKLSTVFENKFVINFERCTATRCISELYNRLRSPAFISWLERVIGISDLHFDPLGGGLHRIAPGGQLGAHIDFNVDAAKRWRRVNVLIYLNQCGVGGELRLFDEEAERVAISPAFNRMVIFECNEHSWHGHPYPLQGNVDRLSVAAYYFTHEAPPDAKPPHSTVWRLYS
jgi:hypothetical protein